MTNADKYPHYYKDVEHLETIDVYRILQLFNVTDPCLQHAIKKLVVAGGRGAKDITKDVAEAIVTLQRWQELREEDASKGTSTLPPFVDPLWAAAQTRQADTAVVVPA